MAQIRVTDWQGNVIHKKKRGFATKKEALAWEQDYLDQASGSLGMSFVDFIDLYMKDMKTRLKESTYASKEFLIDLKLKPFFGKMRLNEIKPTDIRRWQASLTSYRNEKGKPYSATYLRTLNNQVTAIFNYAVKFYGLKENPCHKAGGLGRKNAEEMKFWTKDEFLKFIDAAADSPMAYAAFMTLYYTGMREGELLALTAEDIDFEAKTIRINKSFAHIKGRDIISTPKTARSNRTVTIPATLCSCLSDYLKQIYELNPKDRIFPVQKTYLTKQMASCCDRSGVKKIRVHDLRHSHAAALVEMNVSPKLIQDRLGHERIQTTLDTYGHLYPSAQTELAKQFDSFMSGAKE